MSSPSPRRLLARIACGFLLVALPGLAVDGCGSGRPARPVRPARIGHGFGRLAGYVWTGQVSSVRGMWLAPAIMPQSPAGHGSTWIGAQVAGPSDRAPFIQVGITEDRMTAGSGTPLSREQAFWSATSLGFHPHFLWPVRAGDRIGATLELRAARWRVDIADLSTGRRSSFSTSVEAHGSFAVAEWLQEDPTRSDGTPLPYPRLAPTRFVGLQVNGVAPSYRDVASQWMSLRDRDLAPTPLSAAGFLIAPALLSSPGSRYLSLVGTADGAIGRFEAEASSWRARTPAATISAAADRLASSIGRFAAGLRAGAWPGPARRAIAGLVEDLRAEARVLHDAREIAQRPQAWTNAYESAALTMAGQSRLVRRRLHVPELEGSA